MNIIMKTELIQFHGNDLVAVHRDDDKVYVAIRPICDAMALDWEPQRKRIYRDLILSSVASMMEATGGDGKRYKMICLPLDMLNGWLFGIDARRVKLSLQPTVLDFQRECYAALNAHFRGKALAQNEIYWFARRPRWEFIRRLALEGWPYRAIAKLFDPRLGAGSIANSVAAMVERGLMNPQALAQAQRGVSAQAALRRAARWGSSPAQLQLVF